MQQAVLSELQEEAMAQTLNFVDDDDDAANQEEEFALWKVREAVPASVARLTGDANARCGS